MDKKERFEKHFEQKISKNDTKRLYYFFFREINR